MSTSDDKTPGSNDAIVRIREKHKTLRALIYTIGIVVSIGLTTGALVFIVIKLNDQPPWLQLCLAIFGPTGTVVMLACLYLRTSNKMLDRLNNKIDTLNDS